MGTVIQTKIDDPADMSHNISVLRLNTGAGFGPELIDEGFLLEIRGSIGNASAETHAFTSPAHGYALGGPYQADWHGLCKDVPLTGATRCTLLELQQLQ